MLHKRVGCADYIQLMSMYQRSTGCGACVPSFTLQCTCQLQPGQSYHMRPESCQPRLRAMCSWSNARLHITYACGARCNSSVSRWQTCNRSNLHHRAGARWRTGAISRGTPLPAALRRCATRMAKCRPPSPPAWPMRRQQVQQFLCLQHLVPLRPGPTGGVTLIRSVHDTRRGI